jgi:hypothetical protein
VELSDITITRTAQQAENFNGVYHLSAINATYTPTNGSDLLSVGQTVSVPAIPTTDLSVQYTDVSALLYTYTISAKYKAGTAVPKNNLGDDDPDNKIPGGTFASAKNNVKVSISAGKRRRFWYVGEDMTTTIDNTFFRNIANGTVTGGGSDLESSTSMTKNLTIPAGTKRVVLAVQGANKTLNKVIDYDGMGLDIKDKYNLSTKTIKSLDINGANGFEAKAYTVFVFEEAAGLKATTHQFS